MNNCLYCYEPLSDNENDFHAKCCRAIFGTSVAPKLSLDNDELNRLGKEIVKRSITIPGVQPKLSLHLDKNSKDPSLNRLTIVGLWGNYILKPQTERFKNLPENEDLIMHLAKISGIKTALHTLLRTDSNELVYVTKRFDRVEGNKKVPMEDFCQLSELLSADKYKSSMEKAGNIIQKYASPANRMTDIMEFFRISVFCFLTGNSDMHLKNFSLIKDVENQYRLAPAYDLVSSNLAMPTDKEQIALTLHGKKNRIRKIDFFSFANRIQLPEYIAGKIMDEFDYTRLEIFKLFIRESFLPLKEQENLIDLITIRFKVLN